MLDDRIVKADWCVVTFRRQLTLLGRISDLRSGLDIMFWFFLWGVLELFVGDFLLSRIKSGKVRLAT